MPARSDVPDVTVTQLRERCEGAIGKTFTGYKGGEYTMRGGTRMWVADCDEAGRTAVVNVRDFDYEVVIDTAAMSY